MEPWSRSATASDTLQPSSGPSWRMDLECAEAVVVVVHVREPSRPQLRSWDARGTQLVRILDVDR